ncbi:hypothetical protein [Bacillus cereus]|nr:hypothetical protein [Bacillus cereus]
MSDSTVLNKMPTGLTFVSGYVNKTGTWSQVLGRNTKFIEQIRFGCI